MAKVKNQTFRSWAFVVYEDSAPENWREIIDDRHISWTHSPYHDRDFNADGTPKKPHYHVILDFVGKKSYEQIKEITDSVNAPAPIHLDSLRGYFRYFTHMDNPEKAQYSIDDIRCFGGFDYWESLTPVKTRKYKYLLDMTEFVIDRQISSYTKFCSICAKEYSDTWFPLVTDKYSYYFGKLIDDIAKGNNVDYIFKR